MYSTVPISLGAEIIQISSISNYLAEYCLQRKMANMYSGHPGVRVSHAVKVILFKNSCLRI